MKKIVSILPKVVVPSGLSRLEARAAEVFIEEIYHHTGITLKTAPTVIPGVENVVILTEKRLFALYPELAEKLQYLEAPGPEGFRLLFDPSYNMQLSIFVIGADERGAFYGMGKLLRMLRLQEGVIGADIDFTGLSSTPRYSMRGHQLGYRDKQNTLPCWSLAQFDRYIRELALFGSNCIELLPPRTDDNLFSREMPVDPFDMMVGIADIVASYGLDLWLWYPNMVKDIYDPLCLEAELRERDQVFSALKDVKGILVPAGDPGELEPVDLFEFTAKCATILFRYHPHAKVMLAPQSFSPEEGWYHAFYKEVAKEPSWLYGVSFAPWEQDTIQEMTRKLPAAYRGRIRHYPDITHNLGCQFAMPNWDRAFGLIEGRECSNPRPRAMKYIHNYHAPYCIGSITYSEGIHDDINKFIWGQQDWDSSQTAEATVREYVRLLINADLEDELTRLIFLMEQSWDSPAPIAENEYVEQAWLLVTTIDEKAPAATRGNWRYQMIKLRALGDFYIQRKQRYDDRLEQKARAALEKAPDTGTEAAIREAFGWLDRGLFEACDPSLRTRLLRLSDDMNKSCGIKLTTHHHGGQSWRRGAWLDRIDFPLNDCIYLRNRMKHILRLTGEEERRTAIRRMLDRTLPGPGGIYVDVGSPESRSMIQRAHVWTEDPGMLETANFTVDTRTEDRIVTWQNTWREAAIPKELLTCVQTFYDTPITLTIPGITPKAAYRLRVAYCARVGETPVRLTAGNGTVIHETITVRDENAFWQDYTIPPDCCDRNGCLTLTWQPWGRIRGAAIHELFLIPQS